MTLLTVATEWIVWRAWRSIETWRGLALHMPRHARLALRLLLGRSKTGTTVPTASHNALEQIRRTMPDGRGWWLGWARMLSLGWTSSLLEFVSETGYFLFVSWSVLAFEYWK